MVEPYLVVWSAHARKRAQERCGLTLNAMEHVIRMAYRSGMAYEPSLKVAPSGRERWVKCDGPRGPATAVVEVVV